MTDTHRSFDYSHLSSAERILLVQEIWDSLANDPQAFPLTQAQQQELERRLAASDRGELAYAPWEDVKRWLLNRT